MIKKVELKKNNLILVLFFISILFLTRQFPYPNLGRFASYILVISFLISSREILGNFLSIEMKYKKLFILYMAVLTILFFRSLFADNISITHVVHTFITCTLLIVAFFYPKDKRIIKVFIAVMLIHSLILISFEIYMIINSSPHFNNVVRHYILNNGFGDLYTRNGYYFRIIIKGNELLPVAYLLMHKFNRNRDKVIKAIFLIATVISGNLAYFIAIAFFLVANKLFICDNFRKKLALFYTNHKKKIFAVLLVLLLFSPFICKPIINKIENLIALKMEYSIPARTDQITVLLNDMDNASEIFLGKGMGSTVTAVTKYRDYTGDRYFEMQGIYVFYQLGIIAFSLLIILSILFAFKYMKNKTTLLIYLTYIIYGSTNPYTFNLDHIIVIILLISYDNILNERKNKLSKNLFYK